MLCFAIHEAGVHRVSCNPAHMHRKQFHACTEACVMTAYAPDARMWPKFMHGMHAYACSSLAFQVDACISSACRRFGCVHDARCANMRRSVQTALCLPIAFAEACGHAARSSDCMCNAVLSTSEIVTRCPHLQMPTLYSAHRYLANCWHQLCCCVAGNDERGGGYRRKQMVSHGSGLPQRL